MAGSGSQHARMMSWYSACTRYSGAGPRADSANEAAPSAPAPAPPPTPAPAELLSPAPAPLPPVLQSPLPSPAPAALAGGAGGVGSDAPAAASAASAPTRLTGGAATTTAAMVTASGRAGAAGSSITMGRRCACATCDIRRTTSSSSSYGRRRMSSSQSTMPKLYTSTFSSYGRPLITSGATHAGLPMRLRTVADSRLVRAKPKSDTLHTQSALSSRLRLLRSRCSMGRACACRNSMPLAASIAKARRAPQARRTCGWCRMSNRVPLAMYSNSRQTRPGSSSRPTSSTMLRCVRRDTMLTSAATRRLTSESDAAVPPVPSVLTATSWPRYCAR
mmetsp:Transcript_42302/g.117791  ORF Transcript_42302/g.117791 Transcript_42302/m.117791 type:complete len:333 (+) Transcript_42302:225-1223(+)